MRGLTLNVRRLTVLALGVAACTGGAQTFLQDANYQETYAIVDARIEIDLIIISNGSGERLRQGGSLRVLTDAEGGGILSVGRAFLDRVDVARSSDHPVGNIRAGGVRRSLETAIGDEVLGVSGSEGARHSEAKGKEP